MFKVFEKKINEKIAQNFIILKMRNKTVLKKDVSISAIEFEMFLSEYKDVIINFDVDNIVIGDFKISEAFIPFYINIKRREDIYLLTLVQSVDFFKIINNIIIYPQFDNMNFYKIKDLKTVKLIESIYKKTIKIKEGDFFAIYDNVIKKIEKEIPVKTDIIIEEIYQNLPKINARVDVNSHGKIFLELLFFTECKILDK